MKTDVLVIGGGIAGVLCAWELTRQGVDCVLIEADRVLNGVTRNTTAKITSQHGLIYGKLLREFGPDMAKLYWETNQQALERYRNLSDSVDCNFERRDNFIYALEHPLELEQELTALEQLGIPAAYSKELPLPFPTAGAVCFRNQAQFDPMKLLSALVKTFRVYEHTHVREFRGNQVMTEHGSVRADKIIVATHFPLLNKHGGYFLKMYQDRSYVLALENAPQVDGMYLDQSQDGLSFRNAGKYLLIGGGGHRTGKQGSGWNSLTEFAKTYYPEAKEVCRWATQDCMTLDGVPYIGQYGKHTPNLFVTTGFNKWGMTSAMVSAMILSDLVQEKENPYAAVFSPQRSVWRRQLFVNAAESALNLLTPTAPRCPHLGCALKWNPQERSWDCPCHGSRFSENGKLLDNPATGNRKPHRHD